MTIYFTSDTHFGHLNVLEYCPDRQVFGDIDGMNAALVERWNDTVKDDDTIYHLGDFSMGPSSNVTTFYNQLRGKKIIILGNHDRTRGKIIKRCFGEENVHKKMTITLEGYIFDLIHSSTTKQVIQSSIRHDCSYNKNGDWLECACGNKMRFFDRTLSESAIMGICGHVHQKWKVSRTGHWINVGVDVWDHAPVSLERIIGLVNNCGKITISDT